MKCYERIFLMINISPCLMERRVYAVGFLGCARSGLSHRMDHRETRSHLPNSGRKNFPAWLTSDPAKWTLRFWLRVDDNLGGWSP